MKNIRWIRGVLGAMACTAALASGHAAAEVAGKDPSRWWCSMRPVAAPISSAAWLRRSCPSVGGNRWWWTTGPAPTA